MSETSRTTSPAEKLRVVQKQSCVTWKAEKGCYFGHDCLLPLDQYLQELDVLHFANVDITLEEKNPIQLKKSKVNAVLQKNGLKPKERQRVMDNMRNMAAIILGNAITIAHPKKTIGVEDVETAILQAKRFYNSKRPIPEPTPSPPSSSSNTPTAATTTTKEKKPRTKKQKTAAAATSEPVVVEETVPVKEKKKRASGGGRKKKEIPPPPPPSAQG